ncbi:MULTISPECIES: phospholipase [unclassified Microbacterium]|uniref:aggregation-promoting factor C-terminal-like domain-containing protein n=1 Tax=unclassified Microbacterium TaxID=2609290 RepID=UPI0012FCE2D1|nr:phospholipase [Microbacterium sp. MAH-37]MVQ41903.1 phospholipase [Microbacterium sp. MAH-37]
MLHAPTTRASRRAAAMARAHADVTTRQPIILGVAAAAVLTVAITAGTATAAAAAEAGDALPTTIATFAAAAPDATASAGTSVSSVKTEAIDTLRDAQAALQDAQAATLEVATVGLPLDPAGTTAVDTSELAAGITTLATTRGDSGMRIVLGTKGVAEETAETVAQTAELRTSLETAKQKKAEADAAAKKAAEEKAAAEAAAAALARNNTPEGAKATARAMMSSRYGWGGDQFSCLSSLWTKESGWNYQAYNRNGGATGIPQALPGSKMASAGGDWRTNAATQISWGLDYIKRAYGTPCSAWGHSQAVNWY